MQWIISGELKFGCLLHYEKAFNEELATNEKTKVTPSIYIFQDMPLLDMNIIMFLMFMKLAYKL
jgi:hypothetical protein